MISRIAERYLRRAMQRAADKQPWQMTLKEFLSTGVVRTTSHPVLTFEQFLAEKGVHPREVASEAEAADYIGGTLFRRPNQTMRERGKLKGLEQKVQNRRRLFDEFQRTVRHQESSAPIDPERSSDLALARSQHKRAIRRALGEGKPVPAQVLAEYPELRSV